MGSKNIIFLGGKPGSGKSTLAKTMLSLHDAPKNAHHLSVGDHLRAIGNGTIESAFSDVMRENTNNLAQDRSVPHEVTVGVIGEFITSHQSSELIIIDGLRAPDSLDSIKALFHKVGANVLAVCEIIIGDDVASERVRKRAQRYSSVTEDDAFIASRLQTHSDCMTPTLALMRQDYPYLALDGLLPVAGNAESLLQMYSALSTSLPNA